MFFSCQICSTTVWVWCKQYITHNVLQSSNWLSCSHSGYSRTTITFALDTWRIVAKSFSFHPMANLFTGSQTTSLDSMKGMFLPTSICWWVHLHLAVNVEYKWVNVTTFLCLKIRWNTSQLTFHVKCFYCSYNLQPVSSIEVRRAAETQASAKFMENQKVWNAVWFKCNMLMAKYINKYGYKL